tara:strand:+ start:2480 stop:3145 length:666 start_codon:yes stop_codon:yes gene_type:complete
MGKQKKIVTTLHQSTKRNYIERMKNNKVKCMSIAKKYSKNYWDGNRKYGYGGYKFIPGRWSGVAKKLISIYKLNNTSKVLDVGCGKGYLLHEMKKILPKLTITGFDFSNYALNNSHRSVKKFLFNHKAQKKYPFKKNHFNLVISLGVIHNLKLDEVYFMLKEMQRVGKKSYLMTESYQNDQELFNLQCWALTCKTFLPVTDWKWIFKKADFNGDFEFIFFK